MGILHDTGGFDNARAELFLKCGSCHIVADQLPVSDKLRWKCPQCGVEIGIDAARALVRDFVKNGYQNAERDVGQFFVVMER